jgi:hypothetical protein
LSEKSSFGLVYSSVSLFTIYYNQPCLEIQVFPGLGQVPPYSTVP